VAVDFGVFGRITGYLVVGVQVEEADAGGAAAGAADALGVDADDLAELADDHHLGGVVDEVDAGDLADFGGGHHVDAPLAAAGLESHPQASQTHIVWSPPDTN